MPRTVCLFVVAILLSFSSIATATQPITVSAGAGAMSGSMNVAAAKGFFQAEGVDANVVSYRGGKVAFENYLKGTDDLATCNVAGIIMTDFDISKHRLIGTLSYTDNQTKVLARRSSDITTPSDLRGKKIGIVKATTAHFYISMLLANNGISSEDVEFVYLSKKQLPEAIANAQVDAICQHGKVIEKAKEKLEGDWVVFQDGTLYRISIQLVASQKMLDEQPEVIEGLLRGTLKADEFIKTNTEEAIAILAKDKGYSIEAMTEAVRDEADFHLSLKQSLLIQLEQIEMWAIDNGFVKRTTPRNYLEFIDYAPLAAIAPERVTIIR